MMRVKANIFPLVIFTTLENTDVAELWNCVPSLPPPTPPLPTGYTDPSATGSPGAWEQNSAGLIVSGLP